MNLIIAEKPVLQRAIADAVSEKQNKKDGVIYADEYAICAARGHLLTLKDPEDYDSKYKTWSMDTLPLYWDNWEVKPTNSECQARLNQIEELLKKADIVIGAGDMDDEGQLIVDEILRYFHWSGPTYRLNTGDTTKTALKKALANLSDNKDYEPLGLSAYARSVADMTVGYNCSRYFTLKNPAALLTIGRVQTSALGLVVARDAAIEGHSKVKYYAINTEINIDGKKVKAKFEPYKEDPRLIDGRITDEAYAKSLADLLDGKKVDNIKVTTEHISEEPPLPFNLVKLQTYCSTQFGYEPKQTLEITQSLRDNYNAITYNRSDCQYLTEENYKEAQDVLKRVFDNINFKPKGLDVTKHSACFDNNNVTAHTAIIPQDIKVDLDKLSKEEKDVYLAICKYYILQFMPDAEKLKTVLKAELENGKLSATSTKVIEEGYLSITKKEKNARKKQEEAGEEVAEETSSLSDIYTGTYNGEIEKVGIEEKETKPPSRYTKASLNEDMTKIAQYVKDPKIKALLLSKDKDKKGENGSIGTVATRPDIIEKLFTRKYVEMAGKKTIVSTPLGRELYRILPDELKKPDLTAKWWAIQDDIQKGDAECLDLTRSVLDMVNTVIKTQYPSIDLSKIPQEMQKKGFGGKVLGTCPRCGNDVIEGKKGYGCSNYKGGCKFVIWKSSKMPMMKEETITAKRVSTWLSGGWTDNNDGTKSTKKSVLMKKLLKKDENKFEADIILVDDPSSIYGPQFCIKGAAKYRRVENTNSVPQENEIEQETGSEEAVGKCPICNEDMCESSDKFQCVACNYHILKRPKEKLLAQTLLTRADVIALLNGEAVFKKDLTREGKDTFKGKIHIIKGKKDNLPKIVLKIE